MDESVHDDPFAHSVAKVRLRHAHDRFIERRRVLEQIVDLRPEQRMTSRFGKSMSAPRGWREERA
jgi:hypothetical protein